MPRAPQAQLIWSDLHRHYELHAPHQRVQCFQNGDDPGWLVWLEAHASFAFAGQNGRLSLLKEARPRGSGYWYAYQKQGRQTRKRYLGRSNEVSFARLEQVARVLTSQPESTSSAPELDTPSSEIKGILLSSKLSVPRLPTALVERDRLLICLDEALATPLTLLAAPAGWGKTTLLAAWASRRTGQV
ncbi:MAG: LuxR family transcriptional regulator, partial [Ktedonobacteraceae bacterium]|nr:LuxR family transcriptional regulator [Ktedonobacteraceae bacterium]